MYLITQIEQLFSKSFKIKILLVIARLRADSSTFVYERNANM